jgi:predicted alpha-1,6-mannanase (GH76 family)
MRLLGGEVPLLLLFSGTVFYQADQGGLQIDQIPRGKETVFSMPVRVWRELMDIYYPNRAWLCLHKDRFDRLSDFKRRLGLDTWEQVFENFYPLRTSGSGWTLPARLTQPSVVSPSDNRTPSRISS